MVFWVLLCCMPELKKALVRRSLARSPINTSRILGTEELRISCKTERLEYDTCVVEAWRTLLVGIRNFQSS